MIVWHWPKTDAPRRSDQGARMWACPSYIDATPDVVTPAGCAECPKRAAHNVAERIIVDVPLGQDRYGMIPVAERQDALHFRRLEAALALWHYAVNGYIGNEVVFNAGAANNASQFWTYEIVDAGSGWLDVKGANPKRLSQGVSRLNPEWPGPDPITGQTSRVVWESSVGALPPCAASVEFLYPSVLVNKARPLASRVTPPESDAADGVTRLHFDDGFNVSNATEPFDLRFAPVDGKYYCRVRFEFTAPARWKDYQEPREVQFSPISAEFDEPGVLELLDSADGSTRVLFPWMAPEVFTATFDPPQDVNIAPRLLTVREGSGYKTTLDVSDLEFDTLTLTYWAESTAGDEVRVPVQGECRHSRVDPTGSYAHDGNEHCGRTTSSGFQGELYHERCWLPGRCSEFSLVDESPLTVGDHDHLSGLWTRAGWIIVQAMPGSSASRNFTLVHVAGPSLAGLAGSWLDEVFHGFFPSRTEWFGRRLGRRVTWTESGNAHANLAFGACWLASYDFHASARYVPDAFDELTIGTVAAEISGWTTDKNPEVACAPWRCTGATHVYQWGHGGSSLAKVNTPVASEAYVVGVDLVAAAEPALIDRLRSIL